MPGTALITGGAKRLGKAMALALSRAGYSIAIHCHTSQSAARALVGEIESHGGTAALFEADLCSAEATLRLLDATRERFPDLEILVNNASRFVPGTLAQTSAEDLLGAFLLHVQAPFILTRRFAETAGHGCVINILDTAIHKNNTSHFAYLLAKKTLGHLTTMAALELAPGFRVNAVLPGCILPPEGQTETYLEERARGTPLKRKGSPEQVAAAVLFLVQNENITGEMIHVDGGEHL